MSPQHMSDDLCLDYLTGELPVDKRQSFEHHLGECSLCRQSVKEYRTILRSGVRLVADEAVDDPTLGPVLWDFEEGEKRLYVAIETETGTRVPFEHLKDGTRPFPPKTSGESTRPIGGRCLFDSRTRSWNLHLQDRLEASSTATSGSRTIKE